MRLSLDDDLAGHTLIRLLLRAGHEVVSPRAVGTRGVHDTPTSIFGLLGKRKCGEKEEVSWMNKPMSIGRCYIDG
jgi:hypothetical protein